MVLNFKEDVDKEILSRLLYLCLVRSNSKAITIDGTECQISQYPDNSTLIIDGSAQVSKRFNGNT